MPRTKRKLDRSGKKSKQAPNAKGPIRRMSPKLTSGSTEIPLEMENVAETVGEFIEYWGFKNIHGRIWAHLFLSKEGLDAKALIDRLGVSKALVSISLSDLLAYEVIEPAGRGERGSTIYRTNQNLMTVIANVLRKRERKMLARVSSAVQILQHVQQNTQQKTNPVPSEPLQNTHLCDVRIAILREMVNKAESCLEGLLQFSDVSFSDWTQFNAVDSGNKPQRPESKGQR